MKKVFIVLCAWLAILGSALSAVNINTANKEQLDSLKGIGPAKAQAIIDYRTKHGPFKSIDDLEKVPGIGPATMKGIRKDLSVTGATSVAPAKAAEKAENKAGEMKAPDQKPVTGKDKGMANKKAEQDKGVDKKTAKKDTPKSTDAKGEKKDDKK